MVPMMGELAAPAHHVWTIPILNTGRTPDGLWRQVEIRCVCGWSRISIRELGAELGRLHYVRHGARPQPVIFGLNGADD